MKVYVAIHPYSNYFIGVFATKEALKKQVNKEYSISLKKGETLDQELEKFVVEEEVKK